MTLFDLLFIMLFFTAGGALIIAFIAIFRGRRARAMVILRRLVLCAGAYVAVVYIATALSKQRMLRIGDSECSDDWCIAVDGVTKTPSAISTRYDVSLRIFSRARRVAQREMVARDVYLVDVDGRRYDPVLTGSETPLNTLLQPGESIATTRGFELPAAAHDIGLMIERSSVLPFCVIIGECGAFHKGTVIRID